MLKTCKDLLQRYSGERGLALQFIVKKHCFLNTLVQCTQFPVLIGLTVALGRADGADGRVVPAAEEGNDDEDDHAGHRRDCHLHHTVGAQ